MAVVELLTRRCAELESARLGDEYIPSRWRQVTARSFALLQSPGVAEICR